MSIDNSKDISRIEIIKFPKSNTEKQDNILSAIDKILPNVDIRINSCNIPQIEEYYFGQAAEVCIAENENLQADVNNYPYVYVIDKDNKGILFTCQSFIDFISIQTPLPRKIAMNAICVSELDINLDDIYEVEIIKDPANNISNGKISDTIAEYMPDVYCISSYVSNGKNDNKGENDNKIKHHHFKKHNFDYYASETEEIEEGKLKDYSKHLPFVLITYKNHIQYLFSNDGFMDFIKKQAPLPKIDYDAFVQGSGMEKTYNLDNLKKISIVSTRNVGNHTQIKRQTTQLTEELPKLFPEVIIEDRFISFYAILKKFYREANVKDTPHIHQDRDFTNVYPAVMIEDSQGIKALFRYDRFIKQVGIERPEYSGSPY